MLPIASRVTTGYQKKEHLPLASYAALVGVFNLLLIGVTRKAARRGMDVKLGARELLLLGVAAHKLSRTLTKDTVTAPLRAPFTRYRELLGYGEVNETSRGTGFRSAIGDLVSCNYCADPWMALALLYAYCVLPRHTRVLTSFFSAIALADFLHVIYETVRSHENVLTLHEEKLEREEKTAS